MIMLFKYIIMNLILKKNIQNLRQLAKRKILVIMVNFKLCVYQEKVNRIHIEIINDLSKWLNLKLYFRI
jgi:hypothetical protein